MGAEQSSSRSNGAAGRNATAPRKTCYYEVMGLDRSATDDEYGLLHRVRHTPRPAHPR